MRLFTFGLLFLFLLCYCAWSQETQVTASVDSDSVGVQDQFQLSITISGKDSGDAEAPRLQSLKNFRVVSGPNVSTQFQWINGRTSSNKTFIYLLLPEKEGQFTIDPVEIRAGGKIYKTQPVQIRVTSAPRNPQPQAQRRRSLSPFDPFDPFDEEEDLRSSRPAADTVLVRAEVDRTSAYPGQQVTLTYKVYTQLSLSGFQLQESPPLSGFWVEDLEVEKEPKPVRQIFNGREYLVFTVKKQALFATAPGKLKIPSSVFAFSAETGGGLFRAFNRPETLYRKTQELPLEIKPLPAAGRPQDFGNAVGTFDLNSSIDKTQVAAGEAVALRIKLEGRGNFKMLPDLQVPALPDFAVYSSKRADNVRPLEQDQIGGNKTWEYVIVPKAPGRQTIPPISFSFFNIREEKYQTLTTMPITLTVVRGAETTGIPGLSGGDKQDLVRRGTDINFIKLSPGDLSATAVPLYRSFWFYLIAAIPLALNGGILVYQRQQSRISGNEGLVRSRKARRKALARLAAAEKSGRSEPRRFYDDAAAALSGYLSDRFGLTEIELTGDHLEKALSCHSVEQQTVEEIRSCLQECDFGRFVSASTSQEGMRELSGRIRRNIDTLEMTRVQNAGMRLSS